MLFNTTEVLKKSFSFEKQVAVLIPLKLAFHVQDYRFPSSASYRGLG